MGVSSVGKIHHPLLKFATIKNKLVTNSEQSVMIPVGNFSFHLVFQTQTRSLTPKVACFILSPLFCSSLRSTLLWFYVRRRSSLRLFPNCDPLSCAWINHPTYTCRQAKRRYVGNHGMCAVARWQRTSIPLL